MFVSAKWASATPQRLRAVAAALFGGDGENWAGRGTGLDDRGLARKRTVIDKALARHAGITNDPLLIAAALGGRELAAILGATLAARHRRIPVLLDGFVCTAAAAPLAKLRADALDHVQAAHVSAEAGHRMLLDELKLKPLLDLGMRLGEGSGATLAVSLLRAALSLSRLHGDVCRSGRRQQAAQKFPARWRGRTCRRHGRAGCRSLGPASPARR